jgi:hypothetical protein
MEKIKSKIKFLLFGIHIHKWKKRKGAYNESVFRFCKCGIEQIHTIHDKWVTI